MKWQETYEAVIGLEVHAELKTTSKMFCGCNNDPFGADKPNIYTCPVCLGMPGGIPVANKRAIEWTIKLGYATGCSINEFSKFDRKHYFYPDLAKGYQISQYDLPFCYNGIIETPMGKVRLRRIHLEEDTGKLMHTSIEGKKVSLIDFNRGGVPLVEVVTEPDIKSGTQAKEYGKKLRHILRFLDIADCDMEQGGMRLEANISLRKKGETELPNYKVEIKNINSFRFMEAAIDYELTRQAEILETGKTPVQETRGWNSQKNETFSQRIKEEAEDYRYFPDPDLPPFHFSKEYLAEIKKTLPEPTNEVTTRWTKEFSIQPNKAEELAMVDDAKLISWLEKILNLLKENKLNITSFINDYINKKIEVKDFEEPSSVIEKFRAAHKTEEVGDELLATTIKQVLAENQDAVQKYQTGQKQVFGFLMGQMLRSLGKKVDPQLIRQTLQAALES
ncbi:MAG: Asp-tRNA(Asn)/Glu-tRNA(Gln) amidotransferase GatCAB subunit B [Candidatus Pacebacteria bacterium CG_4_9_14_0_2_um_filter_36_8]|nr:MAG: Asp-tRNA(Asn)/Glu-tRNA(Gln) amidotransferase GatCAB subunit B [Candidatus Pacebacteria bacterium CG_4_9_14_0_2_um_filter_36_8]